jgi:dipeptidyl aminopeptidase/acylaminoacyl peptidase
VAPADGSSAEQVGRFSESVMNLRWTPDGRGMIVTSAVKVDPDMRGQRSSRPPPTRKVGAPEVAWRLPYKEDGVGYLLQREIHLFALDVTSGQARQLTNGPFDVFGFDVSADGRHVAYTRGGEGRSAHVSISGPATSSAARTGA